VGATGALEIRDHRCRLTTAEEPEHDVTDLGNDTRGVERELLEAALGRSTDGFYSTVESLKSAELLLRTRDAADAGTIVDLRQE
jgi:hypothetical protein